jgi:hypothetical protein
MRILGPAESYSIPNGMIKKMMGNVCNEYKRLNCIVDS